MQNPRIGFIGLGLMGHGMAKNLVTKGFPLTVRAHRNRKPLEDLLAAGAKEVKGNADVARDSDIVFLCVTGAPQAAGWAMLLTLASPAFRNCVSVMRVLGSGNSARPASAAHSAAPSGGCGAASALV